MMSMTDYLPKNNYKQNKKCHDSKKNYRQFIKSNTCNRCHKFGHTENNCPNDEVLFQKSYRKKCYKCGKPNHYMNDCEYFHKNKKVDIPNKYNKFRRFNRGNKKMYEMNFLYEV